jgi:O-antigen ligase
MLSLSRPDSGRRWTLPNAVFVTYMLFVAGFYFVPNAVDHYKFYIAAVFLPGLFLLPAALRLAKGSYIWPALLAYLAYMLLSSLWSEDFSAALLWRDIRYTAYILLFILLTLYFFGRDRQLPDAILQRVALVVILAAAASVATFPYLASLPALTEHRLVGWGTMDNPNPSAFIYGFFGVIAVDYARRHRGDALAWVYAIGAVIIILFIILTQSNTSLLALASACALLLFTDRRNMRTTRLALFTGLALVVVTAIYLAWVLGLGSAAIDLGFMNRLPIWRHVLEQWQAAPIFGQGYQLQIVMGDDGKPALLNHAHSLFLSTLRDGGLMGLALLLLLYFFALRAALKMALTERRALYLCLFVFGLVCVLVDTDQVVTRPRELWVILWLPLACLTAYEVGLTGDLSAGSAFREAGGSPKKMRW